MPNILDEIVAAKREELAQVMKSAPLAVVQDQIAQRPEPLSLSGALRGRRGKAYCRGKEGIAIPGVASPRLRPRGTREYLRR